MKNGFGVALSKHGQICMLLQSFNWLSVFQTPQCGWTKTILQRRGGQYFNTHLNQFLRLWGNCFLLFLGLKSVFSQLKKKLLHFFHDLKQFSQKSEQTKFCKTKCFFNHCVWVLCIFHLYYSLILCTFFSEIWAEYKWKTFSSEPSEKRGPIILKIQGFIYCYMSDIRWNLTCFPGPCSAQKNINTYWPTKNNIHFLAWQNILSLEKTKMEVLFIWDNCMS